MSTSIFANIASTSSTTRASVYTRSSPQEPTTWCEIEELVAIDRAYKAILQTAAASKADLIVMGAQGTGGVELMLYGSNTQNVLRAAPCPVLTVHA